jgi:hypothetical protein
LTFILGSTRYLSAVWGTNVAIGAYSRLSGSLIYHERNYKKIIGISYSICISMGISLIIVGLLIQGDLDNACGVTPAYFWVIISYFPVFLALTVLIYCYVKIRSITIFQREVTTTELYTIPISIFVYWGINLFTYVMLFP